MYALVRALFFLLAPETAHHLAATFLRLLSRRLALLGWLRGSLAPGDPRLEVRALGLRFPSPLGVAAGFDKGEGLAPALFGLGFGAVETGTITPRPQPGNPRPRMFRLKPQQALINRMGFNNRGAAETAAVYRSLAFRPGPLGMNLGKNKDTPAEKAPSDYLATYEALRDVGDFFVVNVSSPNTPGLRDLQAPAALRAILTPLRERCDKPLLLKLAPDLADEDIDALSDLARELKLDGLVLTNTTIGRPGAESHPHAKEAGGLSGRPLFERALAVVRRVYARHGEALPIIGVGGIFTGEDAYRMIRAGARLVQVYTAFIYRGPLFARHLHRELLACLQRDGLADVQAAIGLDRAPAPARQVV